MPAAEVEVDPEIVRMLLADQCPELASLPIDPLGSGWDNSVFAVGEEIVVRFPRRSLSATLVENEARWLPELASTLTIPAPVPTYLGEPGHGFPWRWTVAPRLDGVSAATETGIDRAACAVQLGEFLRALHRPASQGAPVNEFRGVPLQARDPTTRERLHAAAEAETALAALWEESLECPVHAGPSSWLHGDLHPHNLLISEGRISAVLDWGDLTSGDPATDLAVAWMLFDSTDRQAFVDAYGEDDRALWTRARGWAVTLACTYLAGSEPDSVIAEVGRRTVTALTE